MREAEFLQAGRFFTKKPSVYLMLRYRLDGRWVAFFPKDQPLSYPLFWSRPSVHKDGPLG